MRRAAVNRRLSSLFLLASLAATAVGCVTSAPVPDAGVPPSAGASPEPAAGERIALLPELEVSLAELQDRYDIPIDVNPLVVSSIRRLQSEPGRRYTLECLGRLERYLAPYGAVMQAHGVPADTIYLAMVESGFATHARSGANASGPWQFMPATGRVYGLKQDFWVDERRDPEKSARAAARYLKQLHREFGDWRLAWASYNAGPARIRKALGRGETDFWAMAGGSGLGRETRDYVPRVMAAAIVAKHPEAFGLRDERAAAEPWGEHETVELAGATPLAMVARAVEVSEAELERLNPELRRFCTPPRPYALRVPRGSAEVFERSWPTLAKAVPAAFARHRVAPGDSLLRIARRYGVPAEAIAELNLLRRGQVIRSGTDLLLPWRRGVPQPET
jgi:membrane-bound lytic murein transglycosylase D